MLARAQKVPKLATADVLDALGDAVAIVPGPFQDFGGRVDFAGPVVTVKTIDDNSLIKDLLQGQGEGRVLIVDGAKSERTALIGGNLAALAFDNGWAGIIVYGSVRDRHELISVDIGVKALGTCPRKSEKAGRGIANEPIALDGVIIESGNWVIADGDGVVVSKELPSL